MIGAPFLIAMSWILIDLVGMRLGQRAAEHGEVLGEHVSDAAVDRAPAGDHAVARHARLLHAEIDAAVLDIHVELLERVLVEQELEPLARGQLAALVLGLGARGAAAGAGPVAADFKLFQDFLHAGSRCDAAMTVNSMGGKGRKWPPRSLFRAVAAPNAACVNAVYRRLILDKIAEIIANRWDKERFMANPKLTRRGVLTAAGAIAAVGALKRFGPLMAATPDGFDQDFKETMTTMFWVGEAADAENDYISNHESYWDKDWLISFGGVDDPIHRNGHWPAGFTPKENPFYVALPYGEFTERGRLEGRGARHSLVSPGPRAAPEEPLGGDPLWRALLLRAVAGCRSVRRGRLSVRVRRR